MFCKNTNLRSLSVSLSLKRKAGNTKLVSFLLFTLLLCIGNSYTYAQTDSTVLDYKNDTTHLLTLTKSGKVGIGTGTPAAQLHTLGTVRFAKFKNNTYEDSVLTTDVNGNLKFVAKNNMLWREIREAGELKFINDIESRTGTFGWYDRAINLSTTGTFPDGSVSQSLDLNTEDQYYHLSAFAQGSGSQSRSGMYG